MCPACATPQVAEPQGVARCDPGFRVAWLLDCARLRPLRALRVAALPGPEERDQIRLPVAGKGAEPNLGEADLRKVARNLMRALLELRRAAGWVPAQAAAPLESARSNRARLLIKRRNRDRLLLEVDPSPDAAHGGTGAPGARPRRLPRGAWTGVVSVRHGMLRR